MPKACYPRWLACLACGRFKSLQSAVCTAFHMPEELLCPVEGARKAGSFG